MVGSHSEGDGESVENSDGESESSHCHRLADDDCSITSSATIGEETNYPAPIRLQEVYGPEFPRLPKLHDLAWEPTQRILHDIYDTRRPDGVNGFCRQRLHNVWDLDFALGVHHPSRNSDHIHLVHLCKWNRRQRRCGCRGMRGITFKKNCRIIWHSDRDA
ncbi:hypothetical protein GE061_015821 [Apolygus lucorum]|uniref:Uncharacterized protein n=1 Tax=Apolygus lucorum TaxID=248454 RepID=A0A8S9XR64_APOLU|nr:hypothetical protein GE061_015821 [Apolygus lucorum]